MKNWMQVAQLPALFKVIFLLLIMISVIFQPLVMQVK